MTQSSNIVHYDQHTQKPVCADLQAFANAFSLCKLTYFSFFCQGELRKQPKFHILLILTGKIHWNGTYLGFKACQIQWHLLWVSMISGLKNGNFRRTSKNGVLQHFNDQHGTHMQQVVHLKAFANTIFPVQIMFFQNPICQGNYRKCRKNGNSHFVACWQQSASKWLECPILPLQACFQNPVYLDSCKICKNFVIPV